MNKENSHIKSDSNIVSSQFEKVSFKAGVRKKDAFSISTYTILAIALLLQLFLIFGLDLL